MLTHPFQMVVAILFGAMFFTRRRGYRILGGKPGPYKSTLDTDPSSARSSDELLGYDPDNIDDEREYTAATNALPKTRHVLCFTIHTPNTLVFKNNIHSRILQRFPFLMEMFYWVVNYAFYRMTAISAQAIFVKTGIWSVAESHAIAVLEFEEFSWLRFLFPIRETQVQQWFIHGHQDALTVLNRVYALIHIPGTVG